jgi:hypothetical protein
MEIEFDLDEEFSSANAGHKKAQKRALSITDFIMRSFPRLAPTKKHAEIILLCIALVSIILSVFITKSALTPPKATEVPALVEKIKK